MEEALTAINNPEIKEAARTHLQIEMDKQSRAETEAQLAASRELWAAIDNGGSLEDVPVATRVTAGSATIADATDYIRNREGGKIIRSDAITLSELNRMMAQKTDRFIAQDLDAYRNLLSRADLNTLKQSQTGFLQQDSQTLKQSEVYEAAFEQADQLLQQLGLSGPNGETEQQEARFLNNLKSRLDHQIAQGNFDATDPDLLPGLIQTQLAADFPQQAAQLQALEEESSSVSTHEAPTLLGSVKTKAVDFLAAGVETFFERYEEDPDGAHTALRLLNLTSVLLDNEELKRLEQVFDDATGEAITALQPHLEALVEKVENGEIDPEDALLTASGGLGIAIAKASKKERANIIKATRSPFTRLIDAVKRKAHGPKTAPSGKGVGEDGSALGNNRAPDGAPNKSGESAPSQTPQTKSALITKLQNNGAKITPENVVDIRDVNGRTVWLETGNKEAGLVHIIERHGKEFAEKGISEKQIPEMLFKALDDDNIVGYQGKGKGRPIYEFDYGGQTHKWAITIGDNGFVVGINRRSSRQ